MNMTKTLIAAATVAAFGFASVGAAVAGDDVTFEALDTSQDGMIARTEIPAGHKMAEKFDQIDTNNDGNISRAEFDAWKMNKEERKGEGY